MRSFKKRDISVDKSGVRLNNEVYPMLTSMQTANPM